MSKYYIANNIQFLRGIGQFAPTPSAATHMKLADAQKAVNRSPDSYMWYRTRTSSKGNDYVVTTRMKFLSNDDTAVNDVKKARAFATAEEAYSHMESVLDYIDRDLRIVIDDKFRHIKQMGRPTTVKKLVSDSDKFSGMDSSERVLIPKAIKEEVYRRSNNTCEICGKPLSRFSYSIDHIIPLSRGGTNNIDNLRAVHPTCNKLKGNFTDVEMKKVVTNVYENISGEIPSQPSPQISGADLIRGCVRHIIQKYKQ